MSDEINYKNNPLHGVSLKNLLIEMVDHYGFEILYAYLTINCFKTNPSIDSSVKFLKKTDWAREKVEAFYLYKLKNLPRASSEQFQLPPRDRIIPDGQTSETPAKLSFEEAERLQEQRLKKSANRGHDKGYRSGRGHDVQRADQPRERDNTRDHKTGGKTDLKIKSGQTSADSETSALDKNPDPWGKWKSKH